MKSVQKVKRILAAAALAGAAFVPSAEAASISIQPASQDANVGDTVFADILVALGANEAVGGVSLLLSFDTSILTGLDFTQDPDGAMGFALDPAFNDFGSSFAGGSGSPLELFFRADLSLPTFADLKALQGAGFRLATVSFTAIAPGLSPLALSPSGGVFLSNETGVDPLAAQATNGSVCVGGPCVVVAPEPVTLSLLGLGLGAFAIRRRRQSVSDVE